jgi:hypothetical protein
VKLKLWQLRPRKEGGASRLSDFIHEVAAQSEAAIATIILVHL